MSTATFDAIVVGAGSVGTPTAMHLAERGLKVLVVDQFASPGQGSNKCAIGGIRATHSAPAKIRLCLASLATFSSWQATHGDDIEWRMGGYCFVAYREEEERLLRELLQVQKRYGLNIDWYDAPALLERVPSLDPEGLRGGTLSPEDGSASPMRACLAFYRRARALGVTFRFSERVTGLIRRRSQVVGVRTDKGGYASETVINAAGAWARAVAQAGGLDTPVVPDCHEAGITEPVARFLDPMVVDIRPMPGSANFYFYQHFTGQVLFCITPSPSIWGYDRRETSTFLPMVAQRMVTVMPKLKNLRVRRTWRGLYPMTPDGFPIVGWAKEVEGFVQAAGLCGQGFMLGPGLGELLTRLVAGTLEPEDREVLAQLSPYRDFVGQELLK